MGKREYGIRRGRDLSERSTGLPTSLNGRTCTYIYVSTRVCVRVRWVDTEE